jgi:Zn-finger protein
LKKQGISFSLESIPEIIDATSFKAMMDNPNATPCPYYKDKKPCHDRIKDFNCFLCSCPGYDAEFVSEEGHSLLVGKCRLNSRKGIYFQHPHFSEVKIWDCSNCSAFHHPKSVEKYLRGHMQE